MKPLRLLLPALALGWLLAPSALADTICPIDFACGFTAIASQAITHGGADATPYAAVGVLKFDSSGTVSVSTTINVNGSSAGPFFYGGGQCIPDLSGIGTVDFSVSQGSAQGDYLFSFVPADNGRELRFINGTLPDGLNLVGVGLCKEQ